MVDRAAAEYSVVSAKCSPNDSTALPKFLFRYGRTPTVFLPCLVSFPNHSLTLTADR